MPTASPRSPLEPLLRRLQKGGLTNPEALAALAAAQIVRMDAPPDRALLQEGSRTDQCCVVAAGFLARYKLIAAGRRQILSFHLPGEIPDLQTLHMPRLDFSLCAIAPSELLIVAHQDLRRVVAACPEVGEAFWRESLIDAAIGREWLLRTGRRSAFERVAHLLCEMLLRLRAAGSAVDARFLLPLTQAELADTLGLSTPHVNRTLRELRDKRLISLAAGDVVVEDWPGLVRVAGFSPDYLYLQDEDLIA